MEKIISLLESKGILKDLPNDRTATAVVLAVKISKDDEVKEAVSEFAFNYTITHIVNRIAVERAIKKFEGIKTSFVEEKVATTQDKDDDNQQFIVDGKVNELFEAIADSIISEIKKEKVGK